MASTTDSRQIDYRQSTPDQLTGTSNQTIENLVTSINDELTMPLRMRATGTHQITVDAITQTNSDTGRNRSIPPINDTLPAFTTGVITIPTTNNNNVTNDTSGSVVLVNIPSGDYVKVGVHLNSLGQIQFTIGTSAASLANATTPPSLSGTFSIGQFYLQNVGGTIQDIGGANLTQYVGGGGGGGGTGDANSFTETLKNELLLSPYDLVTPNIFSIDEDTLVDGSSTGSFSAADGAFEFGAAAETLVSTQMLDPNEFLGAERDLGRIQLTVQWQEGSVDTGATYEVSRDGGNNWQAVTMSRVGAASNVYQGSHEFATEPTFSSLSANATSTTTFDLDATSNQQLAQEITLANDAVLTTMDLDVTVTGAPVGFLFVAIIRDDTGLPSTDPLDIVAETLPIDISGLATGTLTINLPDTPLAPGTYHLAVRTNQAYKDEYTNSAGANKLALDAGGSSDEIGQFDGTTWSELAGTESLVYDLKGRELDLRVRITASAAALLDGYGIFYQHNPVGVSQGVKQLEVVKFKAVADNTDTFMLTNFLPDPDLLNVYYVEGGQVFRYGAFTLDGHTVSFPANTFNNGGVEADITLVFEQNAGSSFDNSDQNAALLAANFLGSTDGTLDKSQAGRGIFLRRPDGTLREITIDNNDNIAVYSV